MEIAIIGAGSVGLLCAAYLCETCTVTVYTRTEEQARKINENGIILKKLDQQIKCWVTASQINGWDGSEDFTIVAVKQYQLESIIDQCLELDEKKLNILFLQNGMAHLKVLSELKNSNVFVGSVEHGAYRENSFTVRHNGNGVIHLALFKGEPALLAAFASSVPDSFPVSVNENYEEMLVNKLMVNAVINPLTAILKVQNGELLTNKHYFSVLENLFSEIVYTLNIAQADLHFQRIIDVCRKTAHNHSSMLKDVEAGRATEIDAILGFLLEEAMRQNKTVPLVTTFYHLVKGKEIGRD